MIQNCLACKCQALKVDPSASLYLHRSVGFHNFQVPEYDAISWKIRSMGCQIALITYPIWHGIGQIFQDILSSRNLKVVKPDWSGKGGGTGQIFNFWVCTYSWKDIPKLGTLPNVSMLLMSSYPNIEGNSQYATQSDMCKKWNKSGTPVWWIHDQHSKVGVCSDRPLFHKISQNWLFRVQSFAK